MAAANGVRDLCPARDYVKYEVAHALSQSALDRVLSRIRNGLDMLLNVVSAYVSGVFTHFTR